MWIFTEYGFFSVVCARKGDGGKSRPVDKTRLMVRARVKQHLESLLGRFGETLDNPAIAESTNTDYRYRVVVSKGRWAKVMAEIARELDYDNFKSHVAEQVGSPEYQRALHDVWAVMHRLQILGPHAAWRKKHA